MSVFYSFFLATRPKTLMAGLSPVFIGCILAAHDGVTHLPSAIAALVGSLLIQIGTNFANDYFDYVNGADTTARKGPTRATAAGLVSPKQMKWAFITTFALAALVGLFLIWRGGWPILVIGIVSILCGILYTGGPYPLGYLGLGDLFVLIFFGPVAVAGTYFVQALSVNGAVILWGLAPGFISTALLAVNNLRDREEDRLSGKKTLAVRFGASFARWEYTVCLAAALIIPFIALGHGWQIWVMLVGMLGISIRPIVMVWTQDGGALNAVLGRTGMVLVGYTVFVYAILS